jgi:hypothetical protein
MHTQEVMWLMEGQAMLNIPGPGFGTRPTYGSVYSLSPEVLEPKKWAPALMASAVKHVCFAVSWFRSHVG